MKTSIPTLVLALAALTVGCDRSKSASAKVDSDLARDLALAGAQAAAPPTFQDTSVAPEPAKAAPAPKPEAPAPRRIPRERRPEPTPPPRSVAPDPVPTQTVAPQTVATTPAPAPAPLATIGAGAAAGMTTGSKVCTNSNLPGDKITATLSSSLTGTNGAVLPAGSTVVLELASATPGQDATSAQMTFRVRSVAVGDKTYEVNAEATPLGQLESAVVPNSDPNATKKKVIGGAIAGAVLGQLIGHNTKGTVIGAATGAAAGAAASKMTEKHEACLPAGAPMSFKLISPLVIS